MVLTTSTTTRTSSASSPRPDTGVHVVCTRTYVRMAYDDAPCTLACIMLLYLLPLGPSTSSRPVPPPPSRPAATDGAATFCWAVATGSERRNPGPAPRRDKRSRVARSIACVAPTTHPSRLGSVVAGRSVDQAPYSVGYCVPGSRPCVGFGAACGCGCAWPSKEREERCGHAESQAGS